MADYENLYLERCNDDWRAAVKEDPNLAVAWAWIAFNSGNPQEVSAARAKAKALAPKLTPGEQLMVAWIAKVQEGDFIGGITAMNDMLEMYPQRQAPALSRGQLADGRERQRSGAAIHGEGARHRQELSRRAERSGLCRCPQPAICQGIRGHGPLRRPAAQRAESAGFLRRTAAHGRELRGLAAALSRRAQDRSGLRDLATRPRRHLRADGQSGAGAH